MSYYYNYYFYEPNTKQTTQWGREGQPQRYPSNSGYSDDMEFNKYNPNRINPKLLDNIIQYERNLPPAEVNRETTLSNITKYNNLLTQSEFDKMLMAQQYQRLYNTSREANELLAENIERDKPWNLSISELVERFANNMTAIIQEMPDAINERDYSILLKDDRLLYVGFAIIIIALLILTLNTTN